MPYHVGRHDRCPASKPHAVIKDSDGQLMGCHATTSDAGKQIAALHAGEKGNSMTVETERRYTPLAVELRAKDELRIGGYAAVFNRMSDNLGGFIEIVAPGFFNDSRSRGWPDVLARYNHDDNMLLGTIGGSTLRLQVDDTGLDYEVDLPQSRSDIAELVSRGDVRKSSFAFRTLEDDWSTTDQGFPQRTLMSGVLVDVAPVNRPAYPDSTAGLRSLAEHVHADIEEVRKLADADELRKFFTRSDGPQASKTFAPAARAALLGRKEDPWVDAP
jgi:HK97 family phage prohead protease